VDDVKPRIGQFPAYSSGMERVGESRTKAPVLGFAEGTDETRRCICTRSRAEYGYVVSTCAQSVDKGGADQLGTSTPARWQLVPRRNHHGDLQGRNATAVGLIRCHDAVLSAGHDGSHIPAQIPTPTGQKRFTSLLNRDRTGAQRALSPWLGNQFAILINESTEDETVRVSCSRVNTDPGE
jgi:hypothetical protein